MKTASTPRPGRAGDGWWFPEMPAMLEEFEAYIPVDGDGEGAGGLVAGG